MYRLVMAAAALLALAGSAFSAEMKAASGIDPAFFENLERFHGHTCAGSLMGARLGLAAKAALKDGGGDGKLKARYSNHSCPVDGIQVAAGTTYGNKAIEVVEEKEHRLLLTAEKSGRQVEARLTEAAQEKGKQFRKLKGEASSRPAGSPERLRLESSVEEILSWFRTAPDAEVVRVRRVR